MGTSVYEIVTEEVLKRLEEGTVPWHQPWKDSGLPRSVATGKAYRGVNVFLLGLRGYACPWWATYKQIDKLGGQVRKGEKSTLVTFWKQLQIEDKDTGKAKRVPMLRYFRVFNLEQADNLPAKWFQADGDQGEPVEPIELCEQMVQGYLSAGPSLTHGSGGAYYRPSADSVNLPPLNDFSHAEGYYSTMFHELTHSTGHPSRLNREGVSGAFHRFGDPVYSREELVAEMGAAMLAGVAGISQVTVPQSAAYVASWVRVLRGDAKLVVQAAGQAQKAADLIQGIVWSEEKSA